MEEVVNMKLSPLKEPDPVAFSMDTIGWEILFALLLLIILYLVYKSCRHYLNNKYRRRAVAEITGISQGAGNDTATMITQIMFQIKQTALLTFGREKVAALKGDQWLRFLEQTAKGVHFMDHKDIIFSSVYKSEVSSKVDFDKNDFVVNSIQWIKKHA